MTTTHRKNQIRIPQNILIFTGALILFVTFVILVSFTAQADNAQRVTNAAGTSAYPSIVANANTTYLAWHDNRTGNYAIYYNMITSPGNVIEWPDGIQISYGTDDSMYPSIAIDHLGYIHITWQDNRDGNWEIYYRKIDATGNNVSAEERVTNNPANSIRPSITIDSHNNVSIVWYDNRTGSYQLFWDKRVEPDIAPVDLTCIPAQPSEGQSVAINVTMENLGDNNATNVQVQLLIDGNVNDTKVISQLNAHTSQTLTYNWNGVFGEHDVAIQVDPNNQIAESNENNNIITNRLNVYRTTLFSNTSLPANATVTYSRDVHVTIEQGTDPNTTGTPNNISKFIQFSTNTSFNTALIKIGYTHAQLNGISEASLRMYSWDPYNSNGPRWVPIADSGVNTIENYVWANVSHFTIFAPLATEPQPVPQPPTQVTDITAWHTWTQDMYKGTGGYPGKYDGQPYTYQSNSTETGNDLYFTFYWDDTTSTVVGPVTGSASATHAYALYGYYNITVTVKHGSSGTESNPSTARQVKMFKSGDTNNDGFVSWRDIDPFVTAMSGQSAYYAAFPTGYFYTGDCNFDHTVNWRDIDPFVARMNT